MNSMKRFLTEGRCGFILALILVFLPFQLSTAQVTSMQDETLEEIDVIEHLGDTVPLDVRLVDDLGNARTVGDYLDGSNPLILIMGYYTCPMLCNLVFNGVTESARELEWTPGKEYRILSVSIDSTETAVLAAAKKKNYVDSFGRPEAAEGWTFAVASADQSRRLADAVGFKYYYDEKREQYAHAAVITILTGEGIISRYLYGIEFSERDLRLALLEASEGNIGSTIDRVMLYCFQYDPDAGSYTLFAANVMKLGGLLTLIVLAVLLGLLWFREMRRRSVRGLKTNAANG